MVFVSYKSEDRERLRPLVEALETEGFDVWWDARIEAGVAWRDSIEQQLESALCVVVAWTERSVGPEGRFVRDEAGRALSRGAYLPVLLDAVRLPIGFGEVQALSLVGWNVAEQIRESQICRCNQSNRPWLSEMALFAASMPLASPSMPEPRTGSGSKGCFHFLSRVALPVLLGKTVQPHVEAGASARMHRIARIGQQTADQCTCTKSWSW
jgi:hypothetical protein